MIPSFLIFLKNRSFLSSRSSSRDQFFQNSSELPAAHVILVHNFSVIETRVDISNQPSGIEALSEHLRSLDTSARISVLSITLPAP